MRSSQNENLNPQRGNAVLLFDGVCNLCNSVVNFVIDRDPKGEIVFAALQSDPGRKILLSSGYPLTPEFNSVILYEDGRFYFKSTAVLRVARRLSGLWKLAVVFLVLPRSWRDAAYDFVAARRYLWFGRRDTCRLPTSDIRTRFL